MSLLNATFTQNTHTAIVFQSLFSWMSLLNGVFALDRFSGSDVSILVLVDVALEHSSDAVFPAFPSAFQSLFSWMSLLNKSTKGAWSNDTYVSIL